MLGQSVAGAGGVHSSFCRPAFSLCIWQHCCSYCRASFLTFHPIRLPPFCLFLLGLGDGRGSGVGSDLLSLEALAVQSCDPADPATVEGQYLERVILLPMVSSSKAQKSTAGFQIDSYRSADVCLAHILSVLPPTLAFGGSGEDLC